LAELVKIVRVTGRLKNNCPNYFLKICSSIREAAAFLLGEGWRSKADCQPYKDNLASVFSLFPPGDLGRFVT
jgi:hypothetical protein